MRYFDELTNMAILTEEVGEVARINGPALRGAERSRATAQRTWARSWRMCSSWCFAWPTRRVPTFKVPSTGSSRSVPSAMPSGTRTRS